MKVARAYGYLALAGGLFACREFQTSAEPALAAGGEPTGGTDLRAESGRPTTGEGGGTEPQSKGSPAAVRGDGGTPLTNGGEIGPLGVGTGAPAGQGGEGGAGSAAGGAGSAGLMERAPFCATGAQGHPVIGITSSTDISVARTYSGVPFVLFMPQPTTEIVALSWSVGTDWVRWACFDAVPAPKRVASGNANDGMLQVYATTELGELFARQELLTGYLPWSQLAPPDSVGLALDVASVDGSVAGGVPWTLYLATDTGVFARTRPIDESQVTDAAWVQVLAGSASRVAAGVLNDGRHDLLAVTERGALVEALQLAPGAQYVFADPLEASHGRRFVDVDFGKNSLGESQTFGVLVDGSLVVRTRSGDGWTDWNELSAATRPTLRSIAVGTLPDQPPILFGIGTYNIPYYSMNAGTSWAPRL